MRNLPNRLITVPDFDPVMRSVVFAGLMSIDPEARLSDAWTPKVLEQICAERLASVGLRLLMDNAIPVPDDSADFLRQRAYSEAVLTMRLTAGLARSQGVLNRHGIPSIGMKGISMRALPGGIGGARCFGDIDILVRSVDFGRALDTLASDGAHSALAESRLSVVRRIWPSVNLSGLDCYEIDLHRFVSPWAFTRRMTFDLLRTDHSVGPVPDTSVLGPEANLVVTAASLFGDASTKYAKAMSWRDIALLLRLADKRVVLKIARQSGTEWMIRMSVDALARVDEQLVPLDYRDLSAKPSLPDRLRLSALGSRLIREEAGWIAKWPLPRALAYAALQSGYWIRTRAAERP